MARKVDANAQTMVASPPSTNGTAGGTMKPGEQKVKQVGNHGARLADCAARYLRDLNRKLHAALEQSDHPDRSVHINFDMLNGWTARIEFLPNDEARRKEKGDDDDDE